MPAKAGIHAFCATSKKAVLFVNKKNQKNFVNFLHSLRRGHGGAIRFWAPLGVIKNAFTHTQNPGILNYINHIGFINL
jgi:hypothetical protein